MIFLRLAGVRVGSHQSHSPTCATDLRMKLNPQRGETAWGKIIEAVANTCNLSPKGYPIQSAYCQIDTGKGTIQKIR
jgi:hypothetical protein